MSTYVDPATALRLARFARAEQLREAARCREVREAYAADKPRIPTPRRRVLRVAWRTHPA